ncbi:MAG: SGNH/GDSL hydrolase family protein, partial [Victivallaceae bacterium]|nr:SGNH/GDSL hydrolase family protein [Victivallaceae bacterium]
FRLTGPTPAALGDAAPLTGKCGDRYFTLAHTMAMPQKIVLYSNRGNRARALAESKELPQLKAGLYVDPAAGKARLLIENCGAETAQNIEISLRLPFFCVSGVMRRSVGKLAPGEVMTEDFPFESAKSGLAPAAAEIDLVYGRKDVFRLWAITQVEFTTNKKEGDDMKKGVAAATAVIIGTAAVSGQTVLFEDFDGVPGRSCFTTQSSYYEQKGVDGTYCVRFTGTPDKQILLTTVIDPARVSGKTVILDAKISGENLTKPEKSFLGPKLSLYYRTADGKQSWNEAPKTYGTYGYKDAQVKVEMPKNVDAVQIQIGIQRSGGVFRLDNVRLRTVTLQGDAPTPTSSELKSALPKNLRVPARLALAGEWKLNIDVPLTNGENVSGQVDIDPLEIFDVKNEQHNKLRTFNPKAGGWERGEKLNGVFNGCTTPGLFVPSSLVVKSASDDSAVIYERGKDYQQDDFWGTVGRLADGRIGENQPVFLDYKHTKLRVDSLFLKDGKIVYRKGVAAASRPEFPAEQPGETRVANLFFAGKQDRLSEDNFYPVQETGYPVKLAPVGDKLFPKTMKKLRDGEKVRIIFWGDSITDGRFISDPAMRYQNQFAELLKQRFPYADIEIITEAWGGRNTDSYFAVPAGQPHNYAEKVLGVKADLVVSEFINDSWHRSPQFDNNYNRIREDLATVGSEWIVIAPSYLLLDGMETPAGQKNIDRDRRKYVELLRNFANENNIACADVSARFGRLWRQGIPFLTITTNYINHPLSQGMKIYAEALIDLFPAK